MSDFDLLNPIKALGDLASSIISKFVPDAGEKLKLHSELIAAQTALSSKAMEVQQQLTEAQSKIIIAEATSESWLARNWRPILMLTFTFIVAWNYVVVPIFGAHAATIPAEMWSMMKIGVAGYIVGRSGEKIVQTVKGK